MIRLALAELRADWRLWTGPLAVLLVTAALLHLATICWISAGAPEAGSLLATAGTNASEVRAGAAVVYVCTGLAAVIVLGSVAAATVDAQRVRIARWRLSGAGPGQVRATVLAQLAVLAVLGSLAGVVAALPCSQLAMDLFVLMGAHQRLAINATPGIDTAAVAVGVALVVSMAGGVRPASRAARVSPVEALRGPVEPRQGMTAARWVGAGLFMFAVLVQVAVILASTAILGSGPDLANATMTNGLMIGVLVVVTMALLAPLILSGVLRLWGALIPPRLSTAWFLARHSTTDRLKQSTAAVIPLMVGASLYGILFGMIATWQASLTATGSPAQLNSIDTYVVLTPVALIAATGSIATVFMTSRSREHEFAVLRTAGATKPTILGMTVAEATIYTVTAILLSLAAIAASVATVSVSLKTTGLPFTPSIDLRQVITLAAAAFLGMVIAVAIPAILSTRAPIRQTLAPQ